MKTYKFKNIPMVIQGDVHINCRLDLEFESNRLEVLANRYISFLKPFKKKEKGIIVFAGDTFDYDTPSLYEIDLFYKFVNTLSEYYEIFIIGGNHDPSCFTLLPQIWFTYIDTEAIIEISEQKFKLVSWKYAKDQEVIRKDNCKFLISHLRSNYGKYIKEEFDFDRLSSEFDVVVLGDIHDAYKPKENIMYTSSPSSTTFNSNRNKHGFISYYRKAFIFNEMKNVPTKKLVKFGSAEDIKEFIESLGETDDYFKVKAELPAEGIASLHRISHPRVKKDITVRKADSSRVLDESSISKIKDFLSSKTDVTSYLFEHIGGTLKLPKNKTIEYLNSYRSFTKRK